MLAAGQQYEGLEAMLIDGDTVYFSVETATPSTSCYLLKGTLTASAVVLDTTFLAPLAKPVAADGKHIYNAGFEALAEANKQVVAFFEFNSFPGQNYAYALAKRPAPGSPTPLPFAPLPFRITDMTPTGRNHFTAINYFFKGGGGDAVYRTPHAPIPPTRSSLPTTTDSKATAGWSMSFSKITASPGSRCGSCRSNTGATTGKASRPTKTAISSSTTNTRRAARTARRSCTYKPPADSHLIGLAKVTNSSR